MSTVLHIEDFSEIRKIIESSPIFQKNVCVKAVQVEAGFEVSTILENGKVETTNVSHDGDYLVTNPNGEEYFIPCETFEKRYEATSEDGVYQSQGKIQVAQNPYDEEVSLMAAWGELQFGDSDCFFASPIDSDEVYIIGYQEFKNTYILDS